MNEELENIVQLHEHSKTHPKCVVLDRNNDVFLIQASDLPLTNPSNEAEFFPTLAAVTVDVDAAGLPVLFAVNLFGPWQEVPGARTPAFPVQVLANR